MENIKDALSKLNEIDRDKEILEAYESDDLDRLSSMEMTIEEFDRFMNKVIENAKS